MPENEGQDNQGQSEGQGNTGNGEGQDQGTDIQGQDDWRSRLPDELKAEKSLEDFKDVGGLAKSYVEAQKMIGNSVRIPKEDASDEDWEAFHMKLGRPETVEGYDFVKPELPENVEWNDRLADWFGKTAHSLGLSKTQANKLMQAWNDNQFTEMHNAQKEMKAKLDVLQESWGDQYEGRVELGVRGIDKMLPAEEAKEFKKLLDSTGFGDHPLMLKYAHQVGKMLKEDGYIIGDGHGGIHSVESAKAKIAEINADLKHPWHAGDKAALEEMDELFKTAYPG